MGTATPSPELPVRSACGYVLGRQRAEGWQYLLLTNRSRQELGFPKGHADPGETEEQTALRETIEETGLVDLDVRSGFRRVLEYPSERKGQRYHKLAIYRFARLRSGEVKLSDEHSAFTWLGLSDALKALPFASLRFLLREAALFVKDRALFDLEPKTQAEADAHLGALPGATAVLVRHLRGGARIARVIATALSQAGQSVHVEGAATATLLHDVGRALGEHADHQRAGLSHLRATPFAPYALACFSHFAKGAAPAELLAAGVAPDLIEEVGSWVDLGTLTREEQCAALADSCMMHDQCVAPATRFADLRARYGALALIDVQERQAQAIRADLHAALGRDPLQGLI